MWMKTKNVHQFRLDQPTIYAAAIHSTNQAHSKL